MNEEAKKIIAFLMKRSGKKSLPESEFYLTISMDMQWCPPKLAKEFVKNALHSGLLEKNEDLLTPTFDVKKIVIPTGFHPSKSSFQVKPDRSVSPNHTIFDQIIVELSKQSDLSAEEVKKKIKTIADEKLLCLDVAALLLAKKYSVEIEPFLSNINAD